MLVSMLGLLGIYRGWSCISILDRCRNGRHGIRSVPPDRHDMAAKRSWHTSYRGSKGGGGHAKKLRRRSFHVQLCP